MNNRSLPAPAAAENARPEVSVIRQRVALAEALACSAFILLYIWRLQSAAFNSWIVFPAWLILSFLLNRDTPKTLGWRADNLWPATRNALLPFASLIAAICVSGLFLGAFHRPPTPLLQPRRFVGYFAFCLLQEVGLQSFLTNRLLTALKKPLLSAVVGGAIFAVMHWPNPILVPLTFVGGTTLCWLFARQRNIIPLAFAQAILGSVVWWAFPLAWHHGMRVGPGYYTFLPPPH